MAAQPKKSNAPLVPNTPLTSGSKTIDQNLSEKVTSLETQRRSLAQHYKEEKRIQVSGAPSYQAHFGRQMPICINGIMVYVPLNGQQYEIPESFAAVFLERLANVNAMENRRSKMADVASNNERYAGESEFIRRA